MTFLPGHFAQSDVQQRAAARYSGDTVATASPAKLVVLLYDRLLLDLTRAQQAQEPRRPPPRERPACRTRRTSWPSLLSSLDTTKWDGAAGLSSIYTFLLAEPDPCQRVGRPAPHRRLHHRDPPPGGRVDAGRRAGSPPAPRAAPSPRWA
ncbi:hypothetical protein GCM10025868_41430 [Angustibacter aerolatus]|uniref:Uncharacterized protein n=1 Tax=Angustibacter aerolatus TaxID=1162965 RepID=A0ABQ6JND4_9ACTN|nr:flagellar protein FliS [Angustibacter aerolatus]GMA88893.1 hypothetical protein GCM10025868_41430 [Angustibacter aerolatus]